MSTVSGFKEPALPWYADQCLPFDITIAAANEYGAAASAKLFGVEILNEGFGTSVDDSVLEQQATFIARSVLPLQAVGRTFSERKKYGVIPGVICGANTKNLAHAGLRLIVSVSEWVSNRTNDFCILANKPGPYISIRSRRETMRAARESAFLLGFLQMKPKIDSSGNMPEQ